MGENVKNFTNVQNKGDYFLTRSDWILCFLSKKNLNNILSVISIQSSEIIYLKKVSNLNNVKIIYLNELIEKEFNMPPQNL